MRQLHIGQVSPGVRVSGSQFTPIVYFKPARLLNVAAEAAETLDGAKKISRAQNRKQSTFIRCRPLENKSIQSRLGLESLV